MAVTYEKLPGRSESIFKEVHRSFDVSRFDIRKDRVYYMPDGLPNLSGVRFLRSGLLIGELKKRQIRAKSGLCHESEKGRV